VEYSNRYILYIRHKFKKSFFLKEKVSGFWTEERK